MFDTDDARQPPNIGTPESAAWFRAELLALGMTQNGFARWMKRRGDDRKDATIQRHVERMASGEVRVSGEMRVILSLMRQGQRRALQRRGLLPGEVAAQPALSDA